MKTEVMQILQICKLLEENRWFKINRLDTTLSKSMKKDNFNYNSECILEYVCIYIYIYILWTLRLKTEKTI